jgi:hypothetical protein
MNKKTDFGLAVFFDHISSDKVVKSKSVACDSPVISS